MQKPFICEKCEPIPTDQFAINPVTDDWVMLFLEEHLIHIHFGPSTTTSEENASMAHFIVDWWDKITAQHPKTVFFFITDLTRKDDGEVIDNEMREGLRHIRSDKQDGGGASFGQTHAMSFLLNLVGHFTKRPVNLRGSYAECVADYERWFAKEENRFLPE